MNFKYFYGTEAEPNQFLDIALFTNDCFKDLSSDAKILYGLRWTECLYLLRISVDEKIRHISIFPLKISWNY